MMNVPPQGNQQAPQQGSTPQIAPQASPPQLGQPASAQPSGRAGQNYDPKLLPVIEKHLDSLPDQQKAFLVQYMTPELAIIFGIVLGMEAFDYFKQYVDPSKQLTVVQRPQGQQAPQGNAQSSQSPAPQQAEGSANASPPQSPKQQAPAQSIMGV